MNLQNDAVRMNVTIKYTGTLYVNILGKAYARDDDNYSLGNLNSGKWIRNEFALGFAKSAENKALFSEINGSG